MVTAIRRQNLKENFVVEITADQNVFISDVSEKLGGSDKGPDPHELIEGALAACTIITVQMYANRKGWKLQSTNVQVKIESEGAQSRISREVEFVGELDADQRQRLLDMANKCPIHNLLMSQITIDTKLKG
jgi:putative redox protein